MTMIKNLNHAHHYDLVAGNGVPFRVLLETDTKDHHGEPVGMVEFYDLRWRGFGPNGQFVTRYQLPAILNGSSDSLNLDGGIESWTVDARNMASLRVWLRNMRDASVQAGA